MTNRQSLSFEGEPLILESDPHMEVDPASIASPVHSQEPLVYIPLRKGRQSLPLEERIRMLRIDLWALDSETEDPAAGRSQAQEDPIGEVHELVQRAGAYVKATGTQALDLGLREEIPRLISTSVTTSLDPSQEPTYTLRTSYPEKIREEGLDAAALSTRMTSRISKLEAVVGSWTPKLGFASVLQSLTFCRKTLSRLDSKYIKILSSQAETIRADLDMIAYQRDNLLGGTIDTQQIDDLEDLLIQFRAISPALEPLLKRLTEARNAQELAAGLKNRLMKVNEGLNRAENKLKESNLGEVIEKWGKFKGFVMEVLRPVSS